MTLSDRDNDLTHYLIGIREPGMIFCEGFKNLARSIYFFAVRLVFDGTSAEDLLENDR